MKIRILEDTELSAIKKRGHRAPSRTRNRKYIKKHLDTTKPMFIRIELDEESTVEYDAHVKR